ncbi:MAG: hypothetical protein GY903_04460 [Fuerstiella sp.]|nr:hypothetical protein [Fuerstiella sp.]MCP4853728.1 hypothetical protein [Fuerstiella sp.]
MKQQWADGIRILVEEGNVYLLIDPEDQKYRETELYPVVDEVRAAFLQETPQEDRQGFVFNPRRSRGQTAEELTPCPNGSSISVKPLG